MTPRPQHAEITPQEYAAPDRDRRDTLLTAGVLFCGFFAVYYATRQQNLSTYHDAIMYLRTVIAGTAPHPHHLVVRWLERGWLWSTGTLTAPPQVAAASAATLSALFGAAAVPLVFLLLRERFGLSRPCASIGAALVGFSYGPWLHATVISLYAMSLAPLLGCLLLLTGDRSWPGRYAAVGVLHAFAVLVHQVYLLFAVVVFFAALTEPHDRVFRRRCFLAYGAVLGALVVVPYILAGIAYRGGTADFAHWITTYAHEGYWNFPGPTNLLKTVIGFARVLFGLLFVFSIPAGRALVERMVSHNLHDEAFVTHDVSPAFASALLGISCLGGILMIALLVASVRATSSVWNRHRRPAMLVAGTLVVFSAFFVWWQPDMLEYWIPQLIMVWLLWSALVLRPGRHVAVRAWATCLLVATLVATNGLGGIRQLGSWQNDYLYACTEAAAPHLEGDAAVLVEQEFLADYLQLFLGVPVQQMIFPGCDDPRAIEPAQIASNLAADAARRGAPVSAYVVGAAVPGPLLARTATPPRSLVDRPCQVWQLAIAADAVVDAR